jgi:transcriptional regulator with GAF, ATPase, and Fis domain
MIERALIITRGHELELPDFDSIAPQTADDVQPDPSRSSDGTSSAIDHGDSDGLAAVNRAHILRVLRDTNWVISGPNGAAARLQMKRSTLNFRMRKLGISRPRQAAPDSPSAGVDS